MRGGSRRFEPQSIRSYSDPCKQSTDEFNEYLMYLVINHCTQRCAAAADVTDASGS